MSPKLLLPEHGGHARDRPPSRGWTARPPTGLRGVCFLPPGEARPEEPGECGGCRAAARRGGGEAGRGGTPRPPPRPPQPAAHVRVGPSLPTSDPVHVGRHVGAPARRAEPSPARRSAASASAAAAAAAVSSRRAAGGGGGAAGGGEGWCPPPAPAAPPSGPGWGGWEGRGFGLGALRAAGDPRSRRSPCSGIGPGAPGNWGGGRGAGLPERPQPQPGCPVTCRPRPRFSCSAVSLGNPSRCDLEHVRSGLGQTLGCKSAQAAGAFPG